MSQLNLAGRAVFSLRLKHVYESNLDCPREEGPFVVQDGTDLLVPLVASGLGRVQPPDLRLGPHLLTLLSGKFQMFTEFTSNFPHPESSINPRLIVAEKGRNICAGSHFVSSAGGTIAQMAIHPNGKWLGKERMPSPSSLLRGMFLHVDIEHGLNPSSDVCRRGFRMFDAEQGENPLKVPLIWEECALNSADKVTSSRNSSRHFVAPADPSEILSVLEWALVNRQVVATGITSLAKAPGFDFQKKGRMSDLCVVQEAEVRLLLSGKGFQSLAGLPIYLSTLNQS